MLRIGLTGGIGCGKSTVAGLFSEYGIPVIDADEIVHRLTKPGTPATLDILSAFGPGFAAADGGIDRKHLARHVFSNPAERQRLEAILHPQVRAAMQQELHRLTAPYCILVIPLLIEAGLQDLVDRVLVVDAAEEIQISRVQKRDGRSEEEIRAILKAQVSRQERLGLADDCINNNGDISSLREQVKALHETYLSLAEKSSTSG
jgi:dephospho-CoA kinase